MNGDLMGISISNSYIFLVGIKVILGKNKT